MLTVNISLTKELMEIVDKEIKEKKYANRSEFFRDLIRQQLIYKKELSKADMNYYKLLDFSLKEWKDKENDGLLSIN